MSLNEISSVNLSDPPFSFVLFFSFVPHLTLTSLIFGLCHFAEADRLRGCLILLKSAEEKNIEANYCVCDSPIVTIKHY